MMPHIRGQDADLRRPIAQSLYLLFVLLEVPRRHGTPAADGCLFATLVAHETTG